MKEQNFCLCRDRRYQEEDIPQKLIINLRDINHVMRSLYEGKGSQKRILIVLKEVGTITQRELTERLGIQPGSASEVLAKLEDAGNIVRVPSKSDRRTMDIALTEQGRMLAETLLAQREERHEEMFSCLSEEEKSSLLRLLEKINEDWEARYQGINLLMRFYDADSGEIWIGRQKLSDISRASLRKNIAMVLQDTVLFSDIVKNNLKYGNDSASDDEIDAAATMSRCKEMIEMLPQGYDTLLTGSGENISQGQRQLLAIASAFVADPKILILDEATSNVDTRTEKAIQDAMHLVMKNRTSIVIAHRLSTIRDADMIVVMDHGRIVESGDHNTLLGQKGKYYELYMTQYAGAAI